MCILTEFCKAARVGS